MGLIWQTAGIFFNLAFPKIGSLQGSSQMYPELISKQAVGASARKVGVKMKTSANCNNFKTARGELLK